MRPSRLTTPEPFSRGGDRGGPAGHPGARHAARLRRDARAPSEASIARRRARARRSDPVGAWPSASATATRRSDRSRLSQTARQGVRRPRRAPRSSAIVRAGRRASSSDVEDLEQVVSEQHRALRMPAGEPDDVGAMSWVAGSPSALEQRGDVRNRLARGKGRERQRARLTVERAARGPRRGVRISDGALPAYT